MTPTITPLRRLGATLAIASFAALGSVAIAPAASADQDAEDVVPAYEIGDDDSGDNSKDDDKIVKIDDGPMSVVKKNNGPDAFIVLEHGKKPVFFCDTDKPKKHRNKCQPVVVGGTRF